MTKEEVKQLIVQKEYTINNLWNQLRSRQKLLKHELKELDKLKERLND